MEYLSKRYYLNHICISGYNSQANGTVEHSHFDVHQSLFKVVEGDQKRWSLGVYSVFWAERVTPRKHMGCSPYFTVTGAHPILPFDIAKATYLQPPPNSIMSMTNLISRCTITLQKCSADVNNLYSKVYQAQLKAAQWFEQQHLHTLKDFDFQRNSLELMRNTQIEKSLNKKMRARYIGPLIVVSCNYGGAYILTELDGTVLHRPFVYSPISLINLSPFPQISSTSMTLASVKWNTVWTQMEMKKIPIRIPQTLLPNKAPYLYLFNYFLSLLIFFISDISPFYTKDTI
jgi:hypothetical protein